MYVALFYSSFLDRDTRAALHPAYNLPRPQGRRPSCCGTAAVTAGTGGQQIGTHQRVERSPRQQRVTEHIERSFPRAPGPAADHALVTAASIPRTTFRFTASAIGNATTGCDSLEPAAAPVRACTTRAHFFRTRHLRRSSIARRPRARLRRRLAQPAAWTSACDPGRLSWPACVSAAGRL